MSGREPSGTGIRRRPDPDGPGADREAPRAAPRLAGGSPLRLPALLRGDVPLGSPLVAAALADPGLLAARPACGFDARSRLVRRGPRRRLAGSVASARPPDRAVLDADATDPASRRRGP